MPSPDVSQVFTALANALLDLDSRTVPVGGARPSPSVKAATDLLLAVAEESRPPKEQEPIDADFEETKDAAPAAQEEG